MSCICNFLCGCEDTHSAGASKLLWRSFKSARVDTCNARAWVYLLFAHAYAVVWTCMTLVHVCVSVTLMRMPSFVHAYPPSVIGKVCSPFVCFRADMPETHAYANMRGAHAYADMSDTYRYVTM